jgi:hypothetical protein
MYKTVGTFKILFAKDSSGIIYQRNFRDFWTMPRLVLSRMIEWISVNNLGLALEKVHTVEFIT